MRSVVWLPCLCGGVVPFGMVAGCEIWSSVCARCEKHWDIKEGVPADE